MTDYRAALFREHELLQNVRQVGESIDDVLGDRFRGRADGNAVDVVERVRSTLLAVNSATLQGTPDDDQWTSILPAWFVKGCKPHPTPHKAEEERRRLSELPHAELVIAFRTARWSLRSWTYWFKEGNRFWFWEDGVAISRNEFLIIIDTIDGPCPVGALEWLCRASGATEFSADD